MSCCISDQFILNDHLSVAVWRKAGARTKQPIRHQATGCHVEVCGREVVVTSSRPAVGFEDTSRLDQMTARSRARTDQSFEGHVTDRWLPELALYK